MRITKTFLVVFVIFILALVVRLISSNYVDVGSDEMIYQLIPLNIIAAERLSTVEQAPLYFYLVDLGYKITGGLTPLTGRLPSIIFGAVGAVLVFLISRELFERRTAALISALLFALSGFAIRHNQEMDMTAYFLVLLSMFFLVQFLKTDPEGKVSGKEGKVWKFYLSALFLALSVLAKPIVLLFVPAYIIVWLAAGYQKQGLLYRDGGKLVLGKKSVQMALIAVLICILVVAPVLVYNYLLYTEKGFTDYYFTVLAGVGNGGVYQGQEPASWAFSTLIRVLGSMGSSLLRLDVLLLSLGLLGIIFAFRTLKKSLGVQMLLLSTVFLLLYLAGKMSSSTHYVWLPLILSIFAGYGLVKLHDSWPRVRLRYVAIAIVLLAVINAAIVLQNLTPLREQSIAMTLRDYSQENIPSNAIIILDPRIYRGIFAWAFHDRHYLEGTYFPELMKSLEQPGVKQTMPLYYIECGPGTNCGWKPEDFQRIYQYGAELSEAFHRQTEKVGEIKAIDTFYVYQGGLALPEGVIEAIDRTHMHWYTPIGWKYPELAVDSYTPATALDKILNRLGLFILYVDVLLAVASLMVVFVLLWRKPG